MNIRNKWTIKKHTRKKTKEKPYKKKNKKRSYKKKKSSKIMKSGGPSGSAITKMRAKEAKEAAEKERIKKEHIEAGLEKYKQGNNYLYEDKDYIKAVNHYKEAGVHFRSAGSKDLDAAVKKGIKIAKMKIKRDKCIKLYHELSEKIKDESVEEEDKLIAQYKMDCPNGTSMPSY